MHSLRSNLTIPVLASAYLLALLSVWSATNEYFPLSIFGILGRSGNVLFHEIGHSLFGFLYGIPNLPSIVTLFSGDAASDSIYMFERRWLLQIIIFGALGFYCYWLYSLVSKFFIPALALTVFVFITSFTKYHLLIVEYMGHGTAIAAGGVLLYLSLADRERTLRGRWLCGFFGSFTLCWNIGLCNLLISDENIAQAYMGRKAEAIFHPDFAKIQTQFGIDMTAMCIVTMVLSYLTLLGVCMFVAWDTIMRKNLAAPGR